MKFTLLAFCSAALLSTSTAADWARYGNDYESQQAYTKQEDLWAQITANKQPYGWYSGVSLGGIFIESMHPTLQWLGDTFEDGLLGARDKYIHSVGNIAKCKLVPVSNSEGYTGLFEGSDYGYIRMSLAKQPDETKTTAAEGAGNFIPGFGLKLLRDGMPSANLVSMYSVDGQESWNFFKNEFHNHIPEAQSTALKLLAKKFEEGTPIVTAVGLSDFSNYTQAGAQVQNPKFPFSIKWTPSDQVSTLFPDDFKQDFQEQLASIPSGTTLYHLSAKADPNADYVHIADLVIETELTSSYFADRYMFFKHQDFREDLVHHPEWEGSVKVASCPFKSLFNSVSSLFAH